MKPSQRFMWLACAAITLLQVGCTNSSVNEIEDLETVSLYSQTDQLAQTLEYIRSIDRYEMSNFRDKVNSGLNRWISNSDASANDSWKLASLAGTLPEPLKSEPAYTNLDDSVFYFHDADYLQQTFWLREISDRVAQSNFIFHQEYLFQTIRAMTDQETLDQWSDGSDDLLVDALSQSHPELLVSDDSGADADAAVRQLAEAIKLFDWTVRNVHLVEARQWPGELEIRDNSIVQEPDVAAFPPVTGTPGPGYVRFPGQSLTYAKGDFLERAKVFAGLCFQRDIPVALLATPAEEGSTRPYVEWICGAWIGGKLFLFDTLTGLPIHGTRPGTIATLSEVKENGELLESLDLTPEESTTAMDYRVKSGQLDELTALVVAPTESLSRRMHITEQNLTGDMRMKLTMDVDSLANTFQAIPGITDVKLWHAPFSTQVFRNRVETAPMFDQGIASRIRWLIDMERYVDLFVQFRTARNSFLLGIFEQDRDKDVRSAISYYYGFMYTDQEINDIERDTLNQRRLGILRDVGQSFAEWQNQLAYMKQNMGIVRADAAFFLAMCNFENGMPSTSLKWIQRIGNYDDDNRWAAYIPYHRGRALESSGQYREAAAEYGRDESINRHGSILRQRLMNQLLDAASDDRS